MRIGQRIMNDITKEVEILINGKITKPKGFYCSYLFNMEDDVFKRKYLNKSE